MTEKKVNERILPPKVNPENEKTHQIQLWRAFHNSLVIRTGFKPVTYCLEGSCSIQLSYRTI